MTRVPRGALRRGAVAALIVASSACSSDKSQSQGSALGKTDTGTAVLPPVNNGDPASMGGTGNVSTSATGSTAATAAVFVSEADAVAGRSALDLTAEDSCGAVKAETMPVQVERTVETEITTETPAPVAILFMLDNSASMDTGLANPVSFVDMGTAGMGSGGDAAGGAPPVGVGAGMAGALATGMSLSRWEQAVNAITAFVESPSSVGLSAGLEYFARQEESSNAGNADLCPTDVPGTASTPMALLPDNAAPIVASLTANQPRTFYTHTVTALQRGVNFCVDYQAQNQDVQCVVVLITDGAPSSECGLTNTCPMGSGQSECTDPEAAGILVPIAAAGLTAGVSTFAIGMDGVTTDGFALLNSIAVGGGTDCNPDAPGQEACNVATTGTDGFIQALERIRLTISKTEIMTEIVTETVKVALDCEWVLPAPEEGEQLEYDLVNLTVALDGSEPAFLGGVASATECALTVDGNGWFYDNPSAPTKIIACPTTCDAITAASAPQVEILLGCHTEPPMLK